MKNLQKHLDFIKDDETRNVVNKIADKAMYVNKNYRPDITDFITPNLVDLSIPIIRNYIKFEIFPSYEHCERKVFILYPQYLERVDEKEFITAIRLTNKSNYKDLKHRDYLGALMSLGISRSKIGDIYVNDDYGDVIVHRDISDYIIYNLDKIGHNKIKIEEIELSQIKYKEDEHEILNITTSSMRLDNIVKHIIKSSRERSASIIKSGAVKNNYVPESKGSVELKEGDLLSISKKGRFRIYKLNGITRKGKLRVQIKHYI